jgi:hypothetical protein
MTGRLRQLYADPTLGRNTTDYEAVYDDYVRFAGGRRVVEAIAMPESTRNADYIFEQPDWDCVIELKQITKYDQNRTLDRYFEQLIREGRVTKFDDLGGGRIRIRRDSLTERQWNRFYDKFLPGLEPQIRNANRQVKATLGLLPQNGKRRFGGAIVLNSGNYNLPTDLLFRFIEYKTKKEWCGGHLRSLDFIICKTIDFYHPDQHPLHARSIVCPEADDTLRQIVRGVYEGWISYANAEIGTQMTVNLDDSESAATYAVDRAFGGKIRLSQHP